MPSGACTMTYTVNLFSRECSKLSIISGECFNCSDHASSYAKDIQSTGFTTGWVREVESCFEFDFEAHDHAITPRAITLPNATTGAAQRCRRRAGDMLCGEQHILAGHVQT